MKTREEIIESMCYRWRHDFGIDKSETGYISCGMTPIERQFLWDQMVAIFDSEIKPFMTFKE
jgi:hypothetical protein